MKCPICGATTEVTRTVSEDALRQQRRYRKCRNGHYFKTVEIWLQNRPAGRPKKTTKNRSR